MEILVSTREVYGTKKVYPVCTKAKLFAQLARTVTLTHESLRTISALGYRVREVVQSYDPAVI